MKDQRVKSNDESGYALMEKAYINVLRKFPNVKKEDISLNAVFDRLGKDFLLGIVVDSPSEIKKDAPKARILAGLQFFLFEEKDMESGIAHELGHYEHSMKSYNDQRVSRLKRFAEQVEGYVTPGIINSFRLLFSKRHRHRWERLQKWYIMKEIYADNKALEAGYGACVLVKLKAVENMLRTGREYPELGYKTVVSRIRNLEEKLGVAQNNERL